MSKSEIEKAAEELYGPFSPNVHAYCNYERNAFLEGASKLLELAEAKHQKVICRSENPDIYWMVIDTRTLRELVEGVPECKCTSFSICENCKKNMSKPQTTGDEPV